MSRETDRKRTVEARLDKLKKRARSIPHESNAEDRDLQMRGILLGTLDLLSDVLLEDEGR